MAVNDTLSSVAVGDYNAITKAVNGAWTRVDLAYAMLQNMEKNGNIHPDVSWPQITMRDW